MVASRVPCESGMPHGYGLCCRMPTSNPDDDTTSGSNIVNPPNAGRPGPVTRQQYPLRDSSTRYATVVPGDSSTRYATALSVTRQQSTVDAMAQAAAAAAANPSPSASQGAQSVTATINYHSLATAMSRLNDDSANNLEKGTQPKWDLNTETFVDWQHQVEMWADSHDIRHLLEHPPVAAPGQMRKHEIAKRIILLTLPNHDRAYV